MKVLILTCNTGQGHNSSAAAIKEVLNSNGVVCDIADTIGFLSKRTSRIIDTCFTGIYRHIPKAFDMGYSKTDKKVGLISSADYLAATLLHGVKRLDAYIKDNGYSHIICVHVFSAIMVTELKKKYGLCAKTSFLSTDYTYYPFMEKTDMDMYFLPHRDMAQEFVAGGVDEDKLVATGIPVRSAFLNYKGEKEAARRVLELPANAKVVFLMGGSMGCGPMDELAFSIAEKADDKFRLLVSCGTNEKLFHSLEKAEDERILPFRYSDNIPQIMTASDLFVTKPGGISITEAGVMGLPMLLLNVVGGCETPNYEFFTSHGFATGAKDADDVAGFCMELLADDGLLKHQSELLRSEFCRNSAWEICRALGVAVEN